MIHWVSSFWITHQNVVQLDNDGEKTFSMVAIMSEFIETGHPGWIR